MQRLIVIFFLELYAVALALLQSLGGVRTDEAKYLLDIPYPHPPLVRWILSQTERFPYQEMLWRVVFATLMIQAVWFIYDLSRDLSKEKRLVLCGLWLTSAAVVLQAGTIMMAPLTALQALIFIGLWMRSRNTWTGENYPLILSMLWLVSLFTAYQIVLYVPIVFALVWGLPLSLYKKAAMFFGPLALLALYTATNPLIVYSMVSAGTQNTMIGLDQILSESFMHWMIGGSLILSILGTIGILRSRSLPLVLSFLLVATYLFLSSRNYYPILYTPLFIGGVLSRTDLLKRSAFILALHLVASAYFVFQRAPLTQTSAARKVAELIRGREGQYLLIQGSFGHEWQYESPFPVRRLKTSLLNQAAAVVCITPCSELSYFGWKQVENIGTEVWFRSAKQNPQQQ